MLWTISAAALRSLTSLFSLSPPSPEYFKGKGVNAVNVSMMNGTYSGANNIREGVNSKTYGEGSDDEYD